MNLVSAITNEKRLRDEVATFVKEASDYAKKKSKIETETEMKM